MVDSVVDATRVCVVGAGVMGLWTAYHLAHRGMDVLVLEKTEPGLEASGASAGTLGIQNKPLPAVALAIRAIEMWRELSDDTAVDIEHERRGGFRLAHTREDVENLEKTARAQQTLGADIEMMYAPLLQREARYLSVDIEAASYCSAEAMANPLAATRALLVGVMKRGVRIRTRSPVTGISVMGDDNFCVSTPRGAIRCDVVVAAGGVWTLDLAQMVGAELPISMEVQQVLTTDVAPPLLPHIVTHARGNLTIKQARINGKILIGGAWCGEGDRRTGLKRVRREKLIGNLKWATQNVPGIVQAKLLRCWAGLEGRTPDKLMLSGSVGSPKGFYVVGCSSGGFTLAPVCGLLTAQQVCGEQTQFPIDPFHVRRFLQTRPAAAI